MRGGWGWGGGSHRKKSFKFQIVFYGILFSSVIFCLFVCMCTITIVLVLVALFFHRNRMLIYHDRQHDANFHGNPRLQATKQHLNNSEMVQNNEK